MSDTAVETTQTIVSFATQTTHSTLGDALQRVTQMLETHLDKLRAAGHQPTVVSVSQSSGWVGHIGFYASIAAVINQ